MLFSLSNCDLLGGSSGSKKKTYTVTFDKNGGDTEAIPKTKTVTTPATTVDVLPAEPIRNGYIFTGWNTSADGSGTEFNTTTPVAGSITIFAQWKKDDAENNGTDNGEGKAGDVTLILPT